MNDPVEAYQRMELKGASLSSAARGEVGRQRAPEGVLCGEEDGENHGVS